MSEHKTIIEAGKRSILPDFKELKQYRDLFYTLAYRDYRVRYAQTFMGLAWAILQPLIYLGIALVIFGGVADMKTDPYPYPVIAITGLIPWSLFAFTLTQSADSLIGNQSMIQKVYFPRIIIPVSKSVVGLVDFAITGMIGLVVMLIYGLIPDHHLLILPLGALILMMASLGVGVWISALTIRFRDVKHVVPFLVQAGMFISPVFYPTEQFMQTLTNGEIGTKLIETVGLSPEIVSHLFYLNPIAGIVDIFRSGFLGTPLDWSLVGVSIGTSTILFITSIMFFRKMEVKVADIV